MMIMNPLPYIVVAMVCILHTLLPPPISTARKDLDPLFWPIMIIYLPYWVVFPVKINPLSQNKITFFSLFTCTSSSLFCIYECKYITRIVNLNLKNRQIVETYAAHLSSVKINATSRNRIYFFLHDFTCGL